MHGFEPEFIALGHELDVTFPFMVCVCNFELVPLAINYSHWKSLKINKWLRNLTNWGINGGGAINPTLTEQFNVTFQEILMT